MTSEELIYPTWNFFQQLIRQHVLDTPILTPEQFSLVDSNLLLTLLDEHRLEPIAYGVLKNLLAPDLPFMRSLHQAYQQQVYQQLRQQKVLAHLTTYLQQQNIPYLLLKGLALNQLLYGTQCLRRCRDIDLIIEPSNLIRVHEYLLLQGFELISCITPQMLLTSKRLLNIYKDVHYFHPQEKVTIELHHRLTSVGSLGLDWRDPTLQKTLTLSGQQIPTFNAEPNFFYLCVHAAFHNWRRLQWLVDLAVFYRRTPLDEDKIYQLAKKNHCERTMLEAKILLQRWFGIAPAQMPVKKWDATLSNLRLRYSRHLWLSSLYKKSTQSRLFEPYAEALMTPLLFPTFRQKIHYINSTLLHGEANLAALQSPNSPLWLVLLIAFWKRLTKTPKRISKIKGISH